MISCRERLGSESALDLGNKAKMTIISDGRQVHQHTASDHNPFCAAEGGDASNVEQAAGGVQPQLRLDTDQLDFGSCAATAGAHYIVVPIQNESGVLLCR